MTLHILALETSSSLCGLALLSQADDGAIDVRTLEHDATSEHAERMLPMVDQLLDQSGIGRGQLSAVAFGQGPGGFTGLRVACGVAQGMGFALGIPVIPVPSLLAAAARDHVALSTGAPLQVVVQDARMGEVYLAAYQAGLDAGRASWREVQAPILLNAEQVGAWLDYAASDQGGAYGAVRLLGDALQACPALAQVKDGRDWLALGQALRADAHSVAMLALRRWQDGGAMAPELAAPIYVRDKVAYTTLERARGAGGNPRAPERFAAIQPMQEAHLDAVAQIEASVQAFPWSRGNFADGLQAGYGAWVAVQAEQVVGFCMVMFAPDVAHVLVIAVAPGSQNAGVGSQLLRHCEQEAGRRGLPAMVLEVRPSNENALLFYRHRGFEQLAVRKDYYPAAHGQREDACVMQKRLP
ncbi:tRNA (adenosine(37)-N6)-threonylcarbamoyltransferase complex dimerization subunit type 1 TsaB [Pusillimonas sp. SM2304]|uniref:tRNA (adenosine(37)-N6)-threonylcarbamoyltransferase complex dimerization subunit type 1 TsaB n=1 Tax=Pusillimonas sp. SM2304 TaxID=3073241 RepID=UPI00287555E9|nr:tRNA (adenosine(37)-N6)-threonylcarbamoyltransferase complex dimerization subunit type 1 TsaB [Pusillimonas sp. SM2304]MDS1140908.1 tRNA (adenosine(37)-N6)-threonylcarbamoyltransferase complex dimerization subunit type 1 TsaB [Pusillimonas sp. SM2304]